MGAISTGILLYREMGGILEVLLVHPGGPFWANRYAGAWSIPKGELIPGEDLRLAALREFEEETGVRLAGEPIDLGEVVQRGGKRVICFAVQGNLDVSRSRSNSFDMEWPPKSGSVRRFPEVDRTAWFDIAAARSVINHGQSELLDRLIERLSDGATPIHK